MKMHGYFVSTAPRYHHIHAYFAFILRICQRWKRSLIYLNTILMSVICRQAVVISDIIAAFNAGLEIDAESSHADKLIENEPINSKAMQLCIGCVAILALLRRT